MRDTNEENRSNEPLLVHTVRGESQSVFSCALQEVDGQEGPEVDGCSPITLKEIVSYLLFREAYRMLLYYSSKLRTGG